MEGNIVTPETQDIVNEPIEETLIPTGTEEPPIVPTETTTEPVIEPSTDSVVEENVTALDAMENGEQVAQELMGTEEVTEEAPKTEEPFNPENISFEEDADVVADQYNFSGFDLSKYKDVFDFGAEASRAIMQQRADEFKSKGYTQDKVEGYIDAIIESKSIKKTPKTQQQVSEDLSKNLNKTTKQNYKPIGNWLKSSLGGDETGTMQYNAIMQNPTLLNVLDALYRQNVGSRNVVQEQPKPKQMSTLSYKGAFDSINKAIGEGKTQEELDTMIVDLGRKVKKEDIDQYKKSIYEVFKKQI